LLRWDFIKIFARVNTERYVLKKWFQMEVSLFETGDKGAINKISSVEIVDICFVLSWHGHAFVRPPLFLQT
jgi:hypothetical protein